MFYSNVSCNNVRCTNVLFVSALTGFLNFCPFVNPFFNVKKFCSKFISYHNCGLLEIFNYISNIKSFLVNLYQLRNNL